MDNYEYPMYMRKEMGCSLVPAVIDTTKDKEVEERIMNKLYEDLTNDGLKVSFEEFKEYYELMSNQDEESNKKAEEIMLKFLIDSPNPQLIQRNTEHRFYKYHFDPKTGRPLEDERRS